MNSNRMEQYWEELDKMGSVYGLEAIQELLHRLGNPQDQLRFIHIAGTNGKGSVAAFLLEILIEAGFRTGRFTSPGVFSSTERFCVDHKEISEDRLAQLKEVIREHSEAMQESGLRSPTLFEVETALAFLYFVEEGCDLVILECGLGGREDATNVVENKACAVITSIGLDHKELLGDTLEAIAKQKAGIIRRGIPVISALQTSEVTEVLIQEAKQLQEVVRFAYPPKGELIHKGGEVVGQQFSYADITKLCSTLLGAHQLQNAALAIETAFALREGGWKIDDGAIRSGLRKAEWKGRFTKIKYPYTVFMDGAHNEAAAIQLRNILSEYYPKKKWIFIMGVLADKEYEKIAAVTASYAEKIYTITPKSPRALLADKLAKTVQPYNPNVTAVESLSKAVELSLPQLDEDTGLLAFGSLTFLDEFQKKVHRSMIRIDKIIQNSIVLQYMDKMEQLEKGRPFCKHGWSHVQDVARIAYILKLERGLEYDREVIYAAALLHDLGRVQEYEDGTPHEQAGAIVAEQILRETGFEEMEISLIVEAIAEHGNMSDHKTHVLQELLFEADKMSRRCFCCQVWEQCNWSEEQKNSRIAY